MINLIKPKYKQIFFNKNNHFQFVTILNRLKKTNDVNSISFNFIKNKNFSLCNFNNSNTNTITNTNSNLDTKKNFPPHLEEKLDMNLFKRKNHPLNIIRNKIVNYFQRKENDIDNKKQNNTTLIKSKVNLQINEDLPKIVDLNSNFFSLLVSETHETLSPKNTYYWDNNNVLRTHMTAHDVKLLADGCKYFLSIGDVYRRDEIDATHYPIFHQVDSVRVFDIKELLNIENPYKDIISLNNKKGDEIASEEVSQNLKEINLLNENMNINPDIKHCLDIVTSDLKYTLQNLNK
jgi:phenylalanyl-tRNA synthetase alpha subunit